MSLERRDLQLVLLCAIPVKKSLELISYTEEFENNGTFQKRLEEIENIINVVSDNLNDFDVPKW